MQNDAPMQLLSWSQLFYANNPTRGCFTPNESVVLNMSSGGRCSYRATLILAPMILADSNIMDTDSYDN
jgi:hypothetical protein